MIIETITKNKTVRVQNYISPDNIIFTEFHWKFCNYQQAKGLAKEEFLKYTFAKISDLNLILDLI